MAGHIPVPVSRDLAREPPSTSWMCPGSVAGAWPTAHGHSWVLHPGRSRFPGPNCQRRSCRHRRVLAHSAPEQHFGHCHGPMWLWSPKMLSGTQNVSTSPPTMLMAAGLTGERPPAGLICCGGVPGAWPMVRSRSRVLNPGQGRFPGRNRRPRHHVGA